MKKFMRHGDVNLHEVSELKGKKIETKGHYILARGEATNSVHEIRVKNPDNLEIYEHEGTIFLRVMEPAEVTHTSDHETIILQPGIYRQVQEREVDHFADSVIRKVLD